LHRGTISEIIGTCPFASGTVADYMPSSSEINLSVRRLFQATLIAEQCLGTRLFSKIFGRVRETLFRVTERQLAPAGAAKQTNVDRRFNLSPEAFRKEYFDLGRPVILSGAARDWSCCKKWNLDYFSGTYGAKDLLLVQAPGLTNRTDDTNFDFLTIRELVEDIRAGGDKYLRFSPLLHEIPELAADLDLGWLESMRGKGTFAHTYYMFFGGKGKKTYLHADQPCNLFVQVYGEKKWTLYHPRDTMLLYPEVTNTAYVKSPVDIDAIDETRFPCAKFANAMIAPLGPGDVLYVPPHVWHQVENLTDTIAVGFRYSSLRAALKSSLTLSLIRILSTNPPVWKTRQYGREDTNLIWAHASGRINELVAHRSNRQKHRGVDEANGSH
jgi:hypothetical protein